MEEQNADQYGTYCSYSGPDRICSADGQCLGSFCQKVHTQRYRYYKSCSPQIKVSTRCSFYLTQTKGEADFKESGNNQYYPIISFYFKIRLQN